MGEKTFLLTTDYITKTLPSLEEKAMRTVNTITKRVTMNIK